MTYQTEEEQVEALKQWWKENGRSVVAGVVLGLGAVLGWRGWHQYQESVAGQASTAFEQLSASIAGADRQATRSQAEQILGKFHSSPYAVFSALALARSYAEDGNAAAARTQLEWALANAGTHLRPSYLLPLTAYRLPSTVHRLPPTVYLFLKPTT